MTRISNKTKRRYQKLLNEGYYLKPNVYSDGTCFEITKDLNPPKNCSGYRSNYGTVCFKTGKEISKIFGLKIKNETHYFGKCPKIPYGMIQH